MDNYESFRLAAREAAEQFESIPHSKVIRLVSHFDADGITSAAILSRMLIYGNRKFHLTNVQSLTADFIKGMSEENYDAVIFSDLGSGQLDAIDEHLKAKKVFILDHHVPAKKSDLLGKNIIQLNPLLHGLDGNAEVSGAGVSYTFAKAVDARMVDFANLAIVGAIADQQEDNGFMGMNAEILTDAVKMGKIGVMEGLRFFGTSTRPLHKVLEFNAEYFIPGVTGSETASIAFLKDIGINPRNSNNEWKKVNQLTETEMQKLIDGIIEKRRHEKDPSDIFGSIYIIKSEERGSQFRDAREFATVLNAAGRLGHTSEGVACCLGDLESRGRAVKLLFEYQYKLLSAFRWLDEKRGTADFIQREGYTILNARDAIPSTIIGTFSSILARTDNLRPKSIVITLSNKDSEFTKISLRFTSRDNPHDLREICRMLLNGFANSEFGGHKNAAGGLLRTEDADKFIKNAEDVLEKICMEESIG